MSFLSEDGMRRDGMRRNGTRMTRVLRIRADLLVRLERNNRAVSVAYMARFPGFLTAPLIRAAWTRSHPAAGRRVPFRHNAHPSLFAENAPDNMPQSRQRLLFKPGVLPHPDIVSWRGMRQDKIIGEVIFKIPHGFG